MEDSNKKKQIRKNICIVCGKEFKASGNCKYCSPECKSKQKERNLHTITCKNCGKTAEVYKNAKFCSDECRIYYKNRQAALRKQNKRNEELTGIENIDYVICQICGMKAIQLSNAHFKVFHNTNISKYKQLYPNAKITSQMFIDRNLLGNNNPGSAENTTLQERLERSPFCEEFYVKRNIDLSKKEELHKNINSKRIPNTKLEYYLNKGYSIIEAKIKLSQRQKTNKHGSYSKESKEFINNILSYIPDNINFKYGRQEFKILNPITGRYYFYDFTDTANNKIIEYNGDFWHVNENNCIEDYSTHSGYKVVSSKSVPATMYRTYTYQRNWNDIKWSTSTSLNGY